jgi:DNA invertase Pin-like site-specific DNA recombinase
MPRRTIARGAGAPGATRFVSYFRVSTDKQGASGLGLEAQREAVSRHVAAAGGIVVAEFTEIETGTNKRFRPEMATALGACRLRRAILVIAKLDRLARNLHFVTGLMESGVEFVACDNPHATKLMIHILVAFAEYEAEAISKRTKEALARAKERGQKLGNPHLTPGDTYRARKAKSAIADERARDVMPYIERAERAGCASLRQLADALNAVGVETPHGRACWRPAQVRRVKMRIAACGLS